jgi:hypothetical protein
MPGLEELLRFPTAVPDRPRRLEPSTLNDVAPLMDQLLPYFLMREQWRQHGVNIPAPLERLDPGDYVGGRPMTPDDTEAFTRALQQWLLGPAGDVG